MSIIIAPPQGLIKMIEKALDYVFPSNFHVVKPLGLGVVGVMVTRLFERKKVTSSKVILLLYLILIILFLYSMFHRHR